MKRNDEQQRATTMLPSLKHRVTLETVATVLGYVLPHVQRTIDTDHVRAMVDDQVAEHTRTHEFSLLQSITVALLDGVIYVLDGQHRVRAFEALRARGMPVEHVIVPVVQYAVHDRDELTTYYNRINQHKPVHPLELDDAWRDEGGFARPFVEWMEREYGAYLRRSSSGAVRCPHISVDQLKMAVLARASTRMSSSSSTTSTTAKKDGGGVDASALCAMVAAFDEELHAIYVRHAYELSDAARRRFEDCCKKDQRQQHQALLRRLRNGKERGPAPDPASSAAVAGATHHCRRPCYLGMFKRFEWLDACLFCLRHNLFSSSLSSPPLRPPPSTVWATLSVALGGIDPLQGGLQTQTTKASPAVVRRAPPVAVRRAVWAKVNAAESNVGTCYACDAELRFPDMECGHVVAHALGGSTDVSNLMPVCRTCNRDMGIQDLEEYRACIRRTLLRDECVSVGAGKGGGGGGEEGATAAVDTAMMDD